MTALAHDTLTGWETTPARPGRGGGAPRPALHLVPTGRAARSSRLSAPLVPLAPLAPLRISRFGRLLLTATAVLVAVALVTMTFAGSASAGIDHTVTVVAGQTLSGIADTELPSLSVADGVAQIQLANHLNTSQVHAGQQLAIPSIG